MVVGKTELIYQKGLRIGQFKQEIEMNFEIGQTVYVQTITKDWVGEVVAIPGPYTVCLKNASWVADSGRLSVFMVEGRTPQMEVEPVGFVTVQWVNWMPWPHQLFDEAI